MSCGKRLCKNELYEIVSKLPKTELHLHLDGSLNSEFMIDSAKRNGIPLPQITDPDQLRDLLMKQKSARRKNKNASLIDEYICTKYKSNSNWKVFDFCNQFLQTEHDLLNATKQLVIDLAMNHNVWLIEVRFCPTLHVRNGLSEAQVTQSVIDGYQAAVDYIQITKHVQLKGGIILCILRSFAPKHWFNIIDVASQYLGKGVIAVDIAGNEADYPLSIFEQHTPNLFATCVQKKVPLTIHAGEWPVTPKTNDNIRIALRYPEVVSRIGHGLTLQFDEDLMRQVHKAGVGVECCLTSNVGGAKKCANYKVHPIECMRKFGIRRCLNSDNTLLSGDAQLVPSPTNEIVKYITELNADWSEVKQVLMYGAQLSFDKTIDDAWINRFEKEIDDVLRSVLHTHDSVPLKMLNELIAIFE
eukprot:664341_1